VFVAALADAQGSHDLARDALLAALPFAAVGALVTFGDYLDARNATSGFQALCSGTIVCLLVLSCAVRNGATHGAPPLAVSSLVAVLGLVGIKLVLAVTPFARRPSRLSPAKP
jgi:hypothetical protein